MQSKIGYFDMHCHILPQVDDGAQSMEMSMEMLELEYTQGVRNVLFTPHCAAGHTHVGEIKENFAKLQEECKKLHPDMTLMLGNELMYSDAILEELACGNALTLNGTDYVLVEFDTGVAWKQMQAAFRRLNEHGYRPVLAHMERFQCLDRQNERIDALISQGVCMQMNAESVVGGIFDGQSRYCRRLIAQGRIHLLGTDAHRTDWRPPDMGRALKELERKIADERLLTKLLYRNPSRLLANAYLE